MLQRSFVVQPKTAVDDLSVPMFIWMVLILTWHSGPQISEFEKTSEVWDLAKEIQCACWVDSLISLQCYQVPFFTILRLVSDIAAHFEPPNQSPLVRHKECTYDDSDQMVFHRNPGRPCLASDGLCNGVLQTIQKKINIGQAKCKLGIKVGEHCFRAS